MSSSTQESNNENSAESSNLEVAREFLRLQNKDLEIRQQEIQAKSKDFDNQKEIALAAIDAQKEDRRETREIYKSVSKTNKITAIILAALLVVLIILLSFLGYPSLAEKAIIYIIGLASGGGVTYGYVIRAMNNTQN